MSTQPVKAVTIGRALMLVLLAFLASIPFVEHRAQFPPIWYGLTFIILTGIGVTLATGHARGLAMMAIGLAAMAALLMLGGPESPRAHIIPGFMLAAAAVAAALDVARAELSKKTHGDARLYHGVSSYILIGVAFALLHQRIDLLMPEAYQEARLGEGSHVSGWGDYVWLSFSILTTSGFAIDVTPANSMSRALCTMEGITGVMFPAMFLARMVSVAEEEDEEGIS